MARYPQSPDSTLLSFTVPFGFLAIPASFHIENDILLCQDSFLGGIFQLRRISRLLGEIPFGGGLLNDLEDSGCWELGPSRWREFVAKVAAAVGLEDLDVLLRVFGSKWAYKLLQCSAYGMHIEETVRIMRTTRA